jgi:glycosyltransferase involved in cell wall biosynthesis
MVALLLLAERCRQAVEGIQRMPVNSKIAFVMDALPDIGGAEKVLMAALELFPDAPIYTLVYNRDKFENTSITSRRVVTSFIERLPFARTQYRKYLPIMPFAIEQFDLRPYETILSFSYAVANGVKVCDGQKLLSYTFTPMRYAWSDMGLDGKRRHPSLILDWIFKRFREWDLESVGRIHKFAAVSGWIAGWIRQAYQRESTVIYPPVEIERFSPSTDRENFYITIARLMPHKRLGLLVDAFNCLKLPLIIIGDGPERNKLERRAAENVRFLGFQPDTVVDSLLNRARAYICPGKEDFGIAMVEAQAAGCPVIAFGVGGAREIVQENQTGIFFEGDTPESLISAVERFKKVNISRQECAANAMRFNKKSFLRELRTFVDPS